MLLGNGVAAGVVRGLDTPSVRERTGKLLARA
ncbi:hypothetical protein BN6_31870 [Saccharothrix espanaensis DSM 44229]|uniref:Uncharacterized protein n=1 Tax=Saccharothrix espanaensis (strain ATCC 51144 / DSM 44229 / JCM 9112 / NBRC 15066 / NRRL 15764) TaxID=1179773 RepID=K0JYZ5_SACES|nr:hypothetical protein BN6_31870 [Saccharothrix espanaensis DSM 44229]